MALSYKPVLFPSLAGRRDAPDYGRVEARGVSVDAKGRVFVFQYSQKHPMLAFDASGEFLFSWGAGLFTMPHGCRVGPDQNLWLTDDRGHRVLHVTPEGKLLQAWGVRNVPGGDTRHFNRPADVAFGPDGSFYVADGYGNTRVVQFGPDGHFRKAWGRHGTGRNEFDLVHSVVVGPDRRLYVADRENQRIQIFTLDGTFLSEWRGIGYPFGLAFLPSGLLVVTDGVANTVSLYETRNRVRQARWGGTGTAPGKFRRAHLCTTDASGAIYVAEVAGKRVQKFVPG